MLICFAAPIDADFYNNRRFDMQPTLCSRCHKNVAVVFITKMENGQAKNEGLCLKCARELHIKPVDDVINKMGLTDEELDGLTNEMMEAMGGPEALSDIDNSDSDSDDDGKTATFPFLNRLFGAGGGAAEAGGTCPRARTTPARRGTPGPGRTGRRSSRASSAAASANSSTTTAST